MKQLMYEAAMATVHVNSALATSGVHRGQALSV